VALGIRRSAFGVWRLAFGVWRLALGVGRWALGVGRSAFGVGRSAFGVRRSALSAAGRIVEALSPAVPVLLAEVAQGRGCLFGFNVSRSGASPRVAVCSGFFALSPINSQPSTISFRLSAYHFSATAYFCPIWFVAGYGIKRTAGKQLRQRFYSPRIKSHLRIAPRELSQQTPYFVPGNLKRRAVPTRLRS